MLYRVRYRTSIMAYIMMDMLFRKIKNMGADYNTRAWIINIKTKAYVVYIKVIFIAAIYVNYWPFMFILQHNDNFHSHNITFLRLPLLSYPTNIYLVSVMIKTFSWTLLGAVQKFREQVPPLKQLQSKGRKKLVWCQMWQTLYKR